MEVDSAKIVAESRILHTFTDFYMHQFVERNKKLVAQGNCIILEWKQSQEAQALYFLKMNNFDLCKQISSSIFVRVNYPKSTSFLFFSEHQQNVVYSITALNQSPFLSTITQLFMRQGRLLDYLSPQMKYETKVRIDFHCEKILQNEVMINHLTSTKLGKTLGKFFGLLSQKIHPHFKSAGQTIDSRLTRFSRQSLSQNARSSWTGIKQKAWNYNQKLTEIVNPLKTKVQEFASGVKQSYKESDNDYIKSVRRFSVEAQTAINDGFYEEKQKENEERNDGAGDGNDSARRGIAKEQVFEPPNLNEESNQRESLLH